MSKKDAPGRIRLSRREFLGASVFAGGGLILGSQDSTTFRLEFSYGDGFHVFFSTSPAQFFRNRSLQL